jgi:HYR domain
MHVPSVPGLIPCGYDLQIEVGYETGGCGDNSGSCAGPDSGFVIIKNNGPANVTGEFRLDGVAGGGTDVHETSGPGWVLAPGASFRLEAGPEGSNQGGFNKVCGGPENGLLLSINASSDGLPIVFQKFDKDIHSGVARDVHASPSALLSGTPLLSDSYILQGGDPFGGDTGDPFETTQTPATFDVKGNCGDPCTLNCSGDITVCNDPGQCSAVVTYAGPSLAGDCSAATIACSSASGSPFPVGTTPVTCTATEPNGALITSCTFNVTVTDAQPPTIICPSVNPVVNTDPTVCTAVVNYTVTATDICAVNVACNPSSGSTFPKGPTTVNCTATDTAGNTAMCSFTVTVVDNQPPNVTCGVAIGVLWPPNHDLVNVGFTATVTDNCDSAATLAAHTVVKVYSNEGELAQGSGNMSPDAKNIASGTLRLRSERSGSGTGRVYLIVATTTDSSGNVGFCSSTVVVPHDQSPASIAGVNAMAASATAWAAGHNGAPPSGYVLIGNGPIVGPKQ